MSAASWFRDPVVRHRLVRVGLVVFFAWLVGRFWHPHYGFTCFLQIDSWSLAATLPELREAPLFPHEHGYDGEYYAQLAARPAADDPALAASLDNVGYRARRMLLSWIAWAAGGGDPVAAVRAYAWLNLAVWAGLTALLGRLFPAAEGWRGTVAWTGVLFSAGVMHSVRLALTDLLGLGLVTGAALLAERHRRGLAASVLGLGGLARETVLLGAVTLLPRSWTPRTDWLRAVAWIAVAVVPLAVWLLYLRSVPGVTDQGLANIMVPGVGWVAKWSEVIRRMRTEPDHYLALTTLLAHLALSVQAAYLLWRPRPQDSWWRLGAVFVGLMLLLGTAVWDGHPGASTRILLPLTLAFNVLAVRDRATAGWLVTGNLAVLAGVLTLWVVPRSAQELAAGRARIGSYVVHADARWYQAERSPTQDWAWAATEGGLQIDFEPRTDGLRQISVTVRAFTPRPLEIRHAGRVLWRGEAGEKLQLIELPSVAVVRGRAVLEFTSPAVPMMEGPGGRALGFAVFGVKVD